MNPAMIPALLRSVGQLAAHMAAGRDAAKSGRDAAKVIGEAREQVAAMFANAKLPDQGEDRNQSLREMLAKVVGAQSQSKQSADGRKAITPSAPQSVQERPRDERGRFIPSQSSPVPTAAPANNSQVVKTYGLGKPAPNTDWMVKPGDNSSPTSSAGNPVGIPGPKSPETEDPSRAPAVPLSPPVDPQQARNESLRQNLSSVVVVQTGDKRSQIERIAAREAPQQSAAAVAGQAPVVSNGQQSRNPDDDWLPDNDWMTKAYGLGKQPDTPERQNARDRALREKLASMVAIPEGGKTFAENLAAEKEATKRAQQPHLPPGSEYIEQRGGAPPVQTAEMDQSKENRDRSLKNRLSDLVFAQSEASRGKVDKDKDRPEIGSQGPGQPPNQPPGSGPGSGPEDDEEEEGVKAAKSFNEKLREGAEKVASFFGPIGKAAVGVVAFVKGLELMNTGVLALNRDLAQFNGQLAAAYAQYDVDEMQRNVHKGEELSGPLSELAAAQSELRDGTNKVSTQVQGLTIGMMTKVTEGVNWLNRMTGLTDRVAGTLEKIREWLFGKDAAPEAGPWQTFFADAQDGKFDGQRPTFRGPQNLHNDQDMKSIFGP